MFCRIVFLNLNAIQSCLETGMPAAAVAIEYCVRSRCGNRCPGPAQIKTIQMNPFRFIRISLVRFRTLMFEQWTPLQICLGCQRETTQTMNGSR